MLCFIACCVAQCHGCASCQSHSLFCDSVAAPLFVSVQDIVESDLVQAVGPGVWDASEVASGVVDGAVPAALPVGLHVGAVSEAIGAPDVNQGGRWWLFLRRDTRGGVESGEEGR